MPNAPCGLCGATVEVPDWLYEWAVAHEMEDSFAVCQACSTSWREVRAASDPLPPPPAAQGPSDASAAAPDSKVVASGERDGDDA